MRKTGWVERYEKNEVGGAMRERRGGWDDVRRTGWVGRCKKDGVGGAI